MKPAVVTAAALLATVVCLGRLLHYGDLRALFAFLALTGVAGAVAWRLASTSAPADTTERAIRVFVALFAVVVFTSLLVGALGRLSMVGLLLAETAVAVVAFVFVQPRSAAAPPAPVALPALAVGVGAALLAFVIGFSATHAPLTLYDSVSYHLYFSARWLQEHAISIVPTPFSDEAQAYAPANGELFFLWLMAPFHGDLLARMGQLPFALTACALLWRLARRLGARPAHAVYPSLFFLLSRPVLEQAVGANVDLVCAAMFLAAVYFGIAAVDRNGADDWAWFGVAAGLYAGSKYLALVYAPILVLVVAMRHPNRRMLWAIPGLAALGLPWYLRNWIAAGSPIYPASLQVAGLTVARGAFTRAAMLVTVFHTRDVRLVPVIAARAFGPTLLLFALPCVVVGAVRMMRRGWWPHGLLAMIPVLMAPLYWYGLPVNIDARFFLPAVAPALVPLAFVFATNHRWNAVVHAVYAAGVVWILVGLKRAIPWHTPWFMDGWFTLDGLVAPSFLPWFAALAIAAAAAWRVGSRRRGWAIPATVLVGCAASVAIAAGGEQWCQPGRCSPIQVTSPYIRPDLLSSWYWLDGNVTNATIAYTGINLPYPLTGERLSNRVVYANIDGHSRWRFHDYDRAYRAGRFEPSAPPLATSSGELLPVAGRSGPRDDAPRPRYERMRGERDGWIYNLRKLHVTYLFVAALSAYEIDYVWHDDRGFPIEETWAASDPAHFRLVYSNPQVRIFAVSLAPEASA